MIRAKALTGSLVVLAGLGSFGYVERAPALPVPENTLRLDTSESADIQRIQRMLQEKQLDAALNAVNALEKSQPKDAAVLNLKGAIYAAKNDFANARRYFERAFAADNRSIAAAMNLAQLDLREKKPEAARKRFLAILANDSANVDAMMALAGVAAAVGQETEYVTWLEKAADASSSAVRPRVLLVNYYIEKNQPQKALGIAQRAQSANPNDVQLLDALGSAQLASGDTKNAVATYTTIAKVDGQNPVSHYKLATAQIAAGNTAAGRSALDRALALKPDYLEAEVLATSLELGARRYDEAMKLAEQIQKRHPNVPAGSMLQGDILMAQQKYTPALKAYEAAWNVSKNSVLAVRIHQALSASGNTQEADARITQWLKQQPNDVTARMYLASTAVRARQYKRAIDYYQAVLQRDPKNAAVLNDLAWAYQQEKDNRALATAEQAYQLRPDNAQIMDTLGWILVDQGKTARGVELLSKAAAQSPASADIRFHLAAALAKSGDKARARKELEDLLAAHKTFPQREEAQALLRQL